MTYYKCHVAQRGLSASHVERARRHDQDEQRCRGMAQPAQQSHRMLPSERLQTGDGSEGGAGAYRAHTPTRRHWCATTTTTKEVPRPRHTTGPTTGPVPIGPADAWRLLDWTKTRGAPLLNWQRGATLPWETRDTFCSLPTGCWNSWHTFPYLTTLNLL